MASTNNQTLWLGLSGAVAACPSLACCLFGLSALAGTGTYATDMGGGATSAGTVSPAVGLVFLCLSLVPWALPAGVWFYFRKKENDNPASMTPPRAPTGGLRPGQPYSPWQDE